MMLYYANHLHNKFTQCFDNTSILKTDNQIYNNIRDKYKLNEYEDDLTARFNEDKKINK